eukprot:TRINITY_DN8034_c0_g1_i1.p1 TRINITY_DN8034_c0_g1~~TRINITY_DN8034_c0_g1_i1.p1  ORF type:complete len:486 (+),score=27.22 TRINITY_DN8034_c0_g1_i1:99-1556(+)
MTIWGTLGLTICGMLLPQATGAGCAWTTVDGLHPPNRHVPVSLSGNLARVNDLNIVNQTLHVNVILRQSWVDERLSWDSTECNETVLMAPGDGLWRPDTYFSNSNEITSTDGAEFTKVWQDGVVLWSKQYILKVFCNMDLAYYPFDTQRCTLDLEAYSTTELQYTLEPLITDSRTEFPSPGFTIRQCHGAFGDYSLVDGLHTEVLNYTDPPSVSITLTLRRVRLKYIMALLLPVWIVMGAAYAFLWVDFGAPPARVYVNVTSAASLLGLMLIHATPPATQITVLDIYYFVCFVGLVLNCVQFSFVVDMATVLKVRTGRRVKREAMGERLRDAGWHTRPHPLTPLHMRDVMDTLQLFEFKHGPYKGTLPALDFRAVLAAYGVAPPDPPPTPPIPTATAYAYILTNAAPTPNPPSAVEFLSRPMSLNTIHAHESAYRVFSPLCFIQATLLWLCLTWPHGTVEIAAITTATILWACLVAYILYRWMIA